MRRSPVRPWPRKQAYEPGEGPADLPGGLRRSGAQAGEWAGAGDREMSAPRRGGGDRETRRGGERERGRQSEGARET